MARGSTSVASTASSRKSWFGWTLSLATNGAAREIRVACRLKEAGEVIQLDKLAYCLAHPALHRKLNFALRLKHAGWIGGSIDVPLDQRGDIYIDAADSTATQAWLDPVKAQAWVLAQLRGQVIAMRAA